MNSLEVISLIYSPIHLIFYKFITQVVMLQIIVNLVSILVLRLMVETLPFGWRKHGRVSHLMVFLKFIVLILLQAVPYQALQAPVVVHLLPAPLALAAAVPILAVVLLQVVLVVAHFLLLAVLVVVVLALAHLALALVARVLAVFLHPVHLAVLLVFPAVVLLHPVLVLAVLQ